MKQIDDILDIEDDLFRRFWREGPQYYTPRSDPRYEVWDFYILMQHHGAPTRLLDWTESALTALHFAIKAVDSEKSKDQENNSINPCVYVLESYRLYDKIKFSDSISIAKQNWNKYLNKRKNRGLIYKYGLNRDDWEEIYLPSSMDDHLELPLPEPPYVMITDYNTRRIAAQRSQFVLFGRDPNYLANHFKETNSFIKHIEIDRDSCASLRTELMDSGVTESFIFPDLGGLGRELNQEWLDRR